MRATARGIKIKRKNKTLIAITALLLQYFSPHLFSISFEEALALEQGGKTAEAIDNEVKKIADEAYKKAKELMEANKDRLEQIAKALLKYETLDAEDVQLILDGGELDKPTVADLLAAEQVKSEQPKPSQEEQQEQSTD